MSPTDPAPRVLVVEDDVTVAEVALAYLRRSGYRLDWARDGTEAAQLWARTAPDVVVLDVMLPGLSGLDLLRRRRQAADPAAVIVVSARVEEEDRVLGLELGADDYLVKPFSPRELVLRVAALLRRADRLAQLVPARAPLRVGVLEVDPAARAATVAGPGGTARPLALTTREFDLLVFLAGHPGQTFSKEELLRRVWGWDFGDPSTVAVHIRRLREKLERDPSDPRLVLTVGRAGYRMARAEEQPGSGPTG